MRVEPGGASAADETGLRRDDLGDAGFARVVAPYDSPIPESARVVATRHDTPNCSLTLGVASR